MKRATSASDEALRRSRRGGLRWWQWLLFLMPALIAAGTTLALGAYYEGTDKAEARWLSGAGALIYGFSAGAVTCVLCGIALGMTTPVRNRVLGCIGWTLLGALTNLPIAFAALIAVRGVTRW
jgi:hypothetical protein